MCDALIKATDYLKTWFVRWEEEIRIKLQIKDFVVKSHIDFVLNLEDFFLKPFYFSVH